MLSFTEPFPQHLSWDAIEKMSAEIQVYYVGTDHPHKCDSSTIQIRQVQERLARDHLELLEVLALTGR